MIDPSKIGNAVVGLVAIDVIDFIESLGIRDELIGHDSMNDVMLLPDRYAKVTRARSVDVFR